MVKQKIFFFFFFLFLANAVIAQTALGFEAGMSSSYLNTNISNRASTAINYNIGYTFNIPFQYRINRWVYLETDPGLTQKNYSVARTDSLTGLYQNYNNTYLQVPLAIKFEYGKRLKVFADAGGYGGYWLSGHISGRVPDIFLINSSGYIENVSYSEKYQFNQQTDNRFEWGWVAGIGAQYHLTTKYILIASCRYYQSMSDQKKDYEINHIPQYNQTFTFSLGLMVSFK